MFVHFPRQLVLTEEEKYLLAQEGVELPTDLPLTKVSYSGLYSVRAQAYNTGQLWQAS